jgi:quercetin dioxygenase-like cupin family protein
MANKPVYIPAGHGSAYWVLGDLFTFLVTGDESGGSYFELEIEIAPGSNFAPHIHRLEDEHFYILEGSLTFTVDGRTFQASKGDFVHIPRGLVHGFKNGPAPARALIAFTPAGIEQFFREVGEPVTDRSAAPPPVTEAALANFAAVELRWKDHVETV